MKYPIYMVVGVPASGKSYVCEKLTDLYEYVHHDGFIHLKQPEAYLNAVLMASQRPQTKPLLIEAPFSMGIKEDLEHEGYKVIPVFIIENENVLRKRYAERGRFEENIIKGHLTRQQTFLARAHRHKWYNGNSEEVFSYLKHHKTSEIRPKASRNT